MKFIRENEINAIIRKWRWWDLISKQILLDPGRSSEKPSPKILCPGKKRCDPHVPAQTTRKAGPRRQAAWKSVRHQLSLAQSTVNCQICNYYLLFCRLIDDATIHQRWHQSQLLPGCWRKKRRNPRTCDESGRTTRIRSQSIAYYFYYWSIYKVIYVAIIFGLRVYASTTSPTSPFFRHGVSITRNR